VAVGKLTNGFSWFLEARFLVPRHLFPVYLGPGSEQRKKYRTSESHEPTTVFPFLLPIPPLLGADRYFATFKPKPLGPSHNKVHPIFVQGRETRSLSNTSSELTLFTLSVVFKSKTATQPPSPIDTRVQSVARRDPRFALETECKYQIPDYRRLCCLSPKGWGVG
jgi:hypothetical protein